MARLTTAFSRTKFKVITRQCQCQWLVRPPLPNLSRVEGCRSGCASGCASGGPGPVSIPWRSSILAVAPYCNTSLRHWQRRGRRFCQQERALGLGRQTRIQVVNFNALKLAINPRVSSGSRVRCFARAHTMLGSAQNKEARDPKRSLPPPQTRGTHQTAGCKGELVCFILLPRAQSTLSSGSEACTVASLCSNASEAQRCERRRAHERHPFRRRRAETRDELRRGVCSHRQSTEVLVLGFARRRSRRRGGGAPSTPATVDRRNAASVVVAEWLGSRGGLRFKLEPPRKRLLGAEPLDFFEEEAPVVCARSPTKRVGKIQGSSIGGRPGRTCNTQRRIVLEGAVQSRAAHWRLWLCVVLLPNRVKVRVSHRRLDGDALRRVELEHAV